MRIESVNVVGRGRVGSAVAARLEERGVALREDGAEVVLLCVPDSAITSAAECQTLVRSQWVGHTSGATPLTAIPHVRRFGLHPLQTFNRSGDPAQLDGAYAAVTGETEEARAVGRALAELLRLTAFDLAEADRAVYHAGAAIASNYLVTLHRAASELFEEAGAPPAGLEPLMRRVIGNGFELDGPDRARGLGNGRAPHRGAARAATAARAALPRARGGNGDVRVVRTIAELQLDRPDGTVGLVPTMGSFHEGHLALFQAARKENDVVVVSLFVNPAQFDQPSDLSGYPRDEANDAKLAERAGVDVLFAPSVEELYPEGHETWVDVERLGSILEGKSRPGHFRGVATICLKLFNLVRPQRAYFGQKDAQQTAVVRRLVRDLNVPVEIRVVPTVRDEDGLALSSRNTRLSPDERKQALTLPRALATRDPKQARELLDGLEVDYVEVADFEPRVLAAAVRVGATRLIDNVVLEGEPA